MALQTTQFDPAVYLTDSTSIAAYLSEALEHEDARGIVDALADVVRGKGGVEILAQESKIDPATIKLALQDTEKPDLNALLRVLHGLGVRLTASLVA